MSVVLNLVFSKMERLKALMKVGAWLASDTKSVNVLVVLSEGTPLSVTRTTTALVLGPCSSVGVQFTVPSSPTVNPGGPLTKP